MSAENKKKNDAIRKILAFIVLFAPASIIVLMATSKCENRFDSLPVFGVIPNYEFVDLNGNVINNKTQEGKITIFTTIQTTCPADCALALSKFNLLIYQDFRKNQKIVGDIKIISIVTDEEGNPVDDLEGVEFMLRDRFVEYDPAIWNLVSGDPKQIYDIENNGVNLYTVQVDSAFAGKVHLETLLLIDKENRLRLVGRGHEEGYIRDFKQNVSLLNGEYRELEKKARNEE